MKPELVEAGVSRSRAVIILADCNDICGFHINAPVTFTLICPVIRDIIIIRVIIIMGCTR